MAAANGDVDDLDGPPVTATKATTGGSFLDNKVVKSLTVYDGKPEEWSDWSFVLLTYIRGLSAPLRNAFKIAQAQVIALPISTMNPAAFQIANDFFVMLAMQTKGEPRRIVRSAEEGNGFAAWRLLQPEYEMQGPAKELLMLREIVA
jgi:hypothetical protein